jgi:transposase
MAGKASERGLLEPQARRLYAEGHSQTAIAELLGVSVSSINRWYAEAARPDGINEWERARSVKRSTLERMREMLDRQLAFVEETDAKDVTAPMVDALSKMAAMIERLDKMDKTRQVADEVATTAKKAGLTPETVEAFRRQILGIAQ